MGATLIILRHGEKPDHTQPHRELELSDFGKARAKFLAATYLGCNASNPVLDNGRPDAFFAITPHTIETASPSAETWKLPVTAFCTMAKGDEKDAMLDERTRQARNAIQPMLEADKNVVVVWEHHRIADSDPAQTTLKNLLNLGIDGVPKAWCGADYDSIWIFRFENGLLASFESRAQGFHPKTLTSEAGAPISSVPV